jgi:activating signal cointegrator complex subunit 3
LAFLSGSGKTIVAEIAMLAVFRDYPDGKVVYIAPLKALVSERIGDWKVIFTATLISQKC